MNWNSQVFREIKSFLIWFLIPITGLISIIKVILDWYVLGTATVGSIFQLLVSVIVVVACGYSYRKTYCRRQIELLAGTSEIGRVVDAASIQHSRWYFLQLSIPVILLTILAVALQANSTSVLILLYAGVIWFSYLSTFMAQSQCAVGTLGLSIEFVGMYFSIPYSSVSKARSQTIENSEQVRVTLYVKDIFPSRVDLPTPIDRQALEALRAYITVESAI